MLSNNDNLKLMKSIRILYSIINILCFLIGFHIIAALLTIFFGIISLDVDVLRRFATSYQNYTHWVIVVSMLNIGALILFFLGLYDLRFIIKTFLKGSIFSQKASTYFKYAGVFFSLSAIAGICARIIYMITAINSENNSVPELAPRYFSLLLFVLVIGLSFVMISKIMKKSSKIKEENDLTI